MNRNLPLVFFGSIARVRQESNLRIKEFTQLCICLILTLGNSCPNRIQILQNRLPSPFVLLLPAV